MTDSHRLDDKSDGVSSWTNEAIRERARAEAAEAEAKALREALEPFAKWGAEIDGNPHSAPYGDACPLGVAPNVLGRQPTVGDLRRARAALSLSPPREGDDGWGGMTLRDYFAGQALVGIQSYLMLSTRSDYCSAIAAAEEAYAIADAMLRVRETSPAGRTALEAPNGT